jgi:hypothetical protein
VASTPAGEPPAAGVAEVAVATPGVAPALSDGEAVGEAVALVTLGVTGAGAADVPAGVTAGALDACAADVDVVDFDVEVTFDVVEVVVAALVVVVEDDFVVVVVADTGGVPAGGVPLPNDQPSADPAAGTYTDAPRVAYCQSPQVPSALREACQYDQYGVAIAQVEGEPSIWQT